MSELQIKPNEDSESSSFDTWIATTAVLRVTDGLSATVVFWSRAATWMR